MKASDFARRASRIHETKRFGAHRGKHFERKAMNALVKRAGAAMIAPRGQVIGYRMGDGSVACVKQRFRTEAAAVAELERITLHASHDYIPVRAYLCDWCNGWHLTSKAV